MLQLFERFVRVIRNVQTIVHFCFFFRRTRREVFPTEKILSRYGIKRIFMKVNVILQCKDIAFDKGLLKTFCCYHTPLDIPLSFESILVHSDVVRAGKNVLKVLFSTL